VYRELEVDGAIETRGRKGTFVRGTPKTDRATARAQQLDAGAQACVAEGRRLGAPAPEIAAAVARALTGRALS
jgi:DNA-binding transcriptional regulator YhcF (GntR family)